jgi:anti-sigma factor RsiW
MSEEKTAHLSPEALHAYLDGMLSSADAHRAEAHLAACEMCSQQIADLRVVFAALASLPDEPPRYDMRAPVMARILPPRRSPALGWLVAAEAFAAALALAAAWGWLGQALAPLEALARETLLSLDAGAYLRAAERLSQGVTSPITRALASLADLHLRLPQPSVPIPYAFALVVAAAALWVIAHRVLLRRQGVGGLEKSAR